MDKNRWTKVREIFSHLSDQSPSFRKQYLDMVCEDEPDIRTEVENMLQANDDIDSHPAFSTDRADTALPETIAGYRITGVLGRGGMSTVYAAEHVSFGQVALKVMPGNLVSHPVARARFQQEAALLQKIKHPALCTVFEIVAREDQAVIAMECASGATLEDILRTDALSTIDALHIAETVADVLTEAHRHGVVHRDLKPSNIMLDECNGAKLIDFGIAKFADANLTATGEVMGSPGYMSPEQWRGEVPGPETDVWSLGVVIYELLSGSHPFATGSVKDTAQQILGDAPVELSFLSGNTRVQRQVEPLLQQMLDKNRHSRLASMDRVRAALRDIRINLE